MKTRSMSIRPSRILSIYDIFQIRELVLEIFRFLPFRDIYTILLKLISKCMTKLLCTFRPKNVLNLTLLRNFSTFTNKFGVSRTELMGYLKTMGGIIAGGFALALFTGELYDTSDIDIYIPVPTLKIFDRKIRRSGIRSFLINNGYHETIMYFSNMPSYTSKYYEYLNESIGRKIQIISKYYIVPRYQLPHSSATSIIKSFDLTTVMCFIQNCSKSKLRFHCAHLPDMLLKRLRFNIYYPTLQDIETFKRRIFPRLLKYKTRGFSICDSTTNIIPEIVKEFEEYEKKDIKRIMKLRFL